MVRGTRAFGRYEAGQGWLLAEVRSVHHKTLMRRTDERGRRIGWPLTSLSAEDRLRLLVNRPHGPEPLWLWLWLPQDGTPMRPHSWEAVYRAASPRSAVAAAGVVEEPPYFTPHMARHSFALYMLVALQHALDDTLRNLRESFSDTVRPNARRLRDTTVISELRAPTQHTERPTSRPTCSPTRSTAARPLRCSTLAPGRRWRPRRPPSQSA